MQSYTISKASQNLEKIYDTVSQSHEPVYISGKQGQMVLLSAEGFEAIQETLYLISIPGMRDSLIKARKEHPESYSEKLGW
ncbi:MAG: hypothetical protein B7X06_04405 [Verrucomicrobia bacterium 21-51-4]|nr:MAG: hypothetical protein B7X06_04405 [Verrucomicrobia bacterium 21-51-4]